MTLIKHTPELGFDFTRDALNVQTVATEVQFMPELMSWAYRLHVTGSWPVCHRRKSFFNL